jgi:hypothetical protein
MVDVRVGPRRSLVRNGIVAGLVGGIPLFGVLYWLAIEQGSWLRVLAVQIVATLIALFLWLRFRAGFTSVDEKWITKQAFLTRKRVPRADVVSVVIAQTYSGNSDLLPQLIALGAGGKALFRMRGIYWRRKDMVRVAEAIGAPILYESEAIPIKDFYASYPGAAYWYEGRPWLAAAGIAIAMATAFAVMSWIMVAIGVPSVLSVSP